MDKKYDQLALTAVTLTDQKPKKPVLAIEVSNAIHKQPRTNQLAVRAARSFNLPIPAKDRPHIHAKPYPAKDLSKLDIILRRTESSLSTLN